MNVSNSVSDLGIDMKIRASALDLFDSVLKQGLVAPWTAVPSLVATCFNSDAMLQDKACSLLKVYIFDQRMDFFESKIIDSLQQAYDFVMAIMPSKDYLENGLILTPDVCRGCGKLYSLFRSKKQTRINFFKMLLRNFANTSPANSRSSLPFLAFCANIMITLPYASLDELLSVIVLMNDVISREAPSVEASLDTMGKYKEDIKGGKEVPVDLKGTGQKAASIALLLEGKRILMKQYKLSDLQVQNYTTTDLKAQRETRTTKCSIADHYQLLEHCSGIYLKNEEHTWVGQCKVFKKLMKQEIGESKSYSKVDSPAHDDTETPKKESISPLKTRSRNLKRKLMDSFAAE